MTGWLRDFQIVDHPDLPKPKANDKFDDQADHSEWNACLFWEFGGVLRYAWDLDEHGEHKKDPVTKEPLPPVMLKEPRKHKITKAICLEYKYRSKDGRARDSAILIGYRGASDS
jgi:hypothetical protein